MRHAMRKQPGIMKLPQPFVINGQEVSNSKYIAEQFNIFLLKSVNQSVIVPHPINNFRTHLTGHFPDNFFMQPTYRLEIIRVMQTLKNKSSEGFDKLSTILVRETINEIATPLEHIINLSFVTGSVPLNLKIAKIIPIFKSGNNQLFNNYRPISILPALSKIIEKLTVIIL